MSTSVNRLNYAQVVISLVSAVALLVISGAQFFIRTSSRDRQLVRVQRQIRFDGAYLLGKPEGNRSRKIVEDGLKTHRLKIVDPPQYNRIISPVVDNSRDSIQDCSDMLYKVRNALSRTHGKLASLMTMRCCLSCIKGLQNSENTERFLHVYEAIVFGLHRMDGRDIVTSQDIKFMHAFFYNTIIRVLE